MKSPYERCLNPACQREQACQSEAFCIANAEKDIWNEAIEAAAKECDRAAGQPRMYTDSARRMAGQCAHAIRALKRQ